MTRLDDAILTAKLEAENTILRIAADTPAANGNGGMKAADKVEDIGQNVSWILWSVLRWVGIGIGVILCIIGVVKVFKYVRGRKDPEHAQEKGSLVSIILIFAVAAVLIVGSTVAFAALLKGAGNLSNGLTDDNTNDFRSMFK